MRQRVELGNSTLIPGFERTIIHLNKAKILQEPSTNKYLLLTKYYATSRESYSQIKLVIELCDTSKQSFWNLCQHVGAKVPISEWDQWGKQHSGIYV